MKGIYVIAIAFLASWAVSAANSEREEDSYHDMPIWPIPTVCPLPERFPENTTTNLPHEYDCTKFYKCFLGEGVEQLCPLMTEGDPVSRLHYNRLLQVCDWPWQAGCSSCPQRNPDGSYPASSRISGPDNCRQYYECVNGMPTLRECPSGTCFSRTCQECVKYRDGGCCCSGGCPIKPTKKPDLCPGGNPNGDTKEHECNCAQYYVCYPPDWIAGEQCDGGLHYSPSQKKCLPPNEAGCRVVHNQ